MQKSDIFRLWDMLDILCAGSPASAKPERGDRKTAYAWQLALEPYDYEAVRAAALEHCRRSRYYPTISEIVEHIPGEPSRDDAAEQSAMGYDTGELQKYLARFDKIHAALVDEYRRNNEMTPMEARAAGVDFFRREDVNTAPGNSDFGGRK